jgi:diguanylate cyclase (GGDEF)-like protein
VPMVVGQELIGVLNFERERRADFSADEIEFFGAIADQAAVAIQKARLHEQTVTLSITDPLTLIPNRRFLFQQLESEINRANRFGTQLSLLMIDIDHFKKLNDQEGHQAGDDVLRQVAETMKSTLRKVDTVGRYGGEEFIVLLPQVTRVEALEVGEKLRRAVQAVEFSFGKKETTHKVSISVGVASLPVDASAQTELVDAADAALYIAKREGRNRVVAYSVGMEIHPDRRRKLVTAS